MWRSPVEPSGYDDPEEDETGKIFEGGMKKNFNFGAPVAPSSLAPERAGPPMGRSIIASKLKKRR